MKQNIYIAALLAGMLALAGCGGGNSSTPATAAVVEGAAPSGGGGTPDVEETANIFDASDCKAGTKVNDAGDGCIADTSEMDADAAETMAKNLHAALVGADANDEDRGIASEANTKNANNQTYSFDGKKVTVDPEGSENLPGSFDLAGTADAVSANSGWTGGHFKGKGDKKDHESRVYWLAETKAKGTKFSALTDIGHGSISGNVIMFTGFGGTPSDRVVINGFTGTSGQLTPPGARTTGTGDMAVHTWPGSYYGVPGTYSCTGQPSETNCQVSRHAGEKRILVGSMWTFTVTDANKDMEVTAADNKYSYYGWWLNKASGGYQFDHLFGSTGTALTRENVNNADGTATYNGGAAGKYAIYSTTPKAAESGDFTANVMLTADFDVPATMTTITGTIDKFMVDGSEKEGWEVDIVKNSGNSDENTNLFGGTAVWSIGENKGANGSWSADFHDAGTDGIPKIVVGGFDVANDSAKMIGAFGASKQ